MEKWLDKGLKALAAVGGFIAGLFGGWDMMLIVLLVVMVIDYLSGVIVAFMNKSLKTEGGGLNSQVGAKGILKKTMMLLAVAFGAALDKVLGDQAMFRNMVVFFLIANEGLSIMENMAIAGVDLPPKMKNALEQWKDKGNKEKE